MPNVRTIAVCVLTSVLISGCSNTSAKEIVEGYSTEIEDIVKERAEEKAAEIAKNVLDRLKETDAASSIRTASEYAVDTYEYATSEENVEKAKETVNTTKEDTITFFEFMFSQIESNWKNVVEIIGKPSSEFADTEVDPVEDIQYFSEYDFYGTYKNPWKESQGIDTSADGTVLEQLRNDLKKLSEKAKETANDIKEYHDEKRVASKSNVAENENITDAQSSISRKTVEELSNIILSIVPDFDGRSYAIINDNKPFFDENERTLDVFECYSELDELGRAQVAFANICKELMPTSERESITIRPSGWKQAKYDILKNTSDNPQGYLFARCHIIGRQLAGEEGNEKNLITGTFFFNVKGMEPFENYVASYVRKYNRHVLYRVTPIYKGNNLIASGVLMEAQSVEDDSISFCVYVYNVAPGVVIDYSNGNSHISE